MAAETERGESTEVEVRGPGDTADGELERKAGRLGELVLRRHRGLLQVISNGTFLISEENDASSRALIDAARPWLPDGPLDVLVGGLGLGFAAEQALGLAALRSLVVVELEPVVVEWFDRYAAGRARLLRADPRVSIVVADVLDLLQAEEDRYDLICLDTDNGPEWLVHQANAPLYGPAGIGTVRRALRAGGVAVFWSPGRYPAFEATLAGAFDVVRPEGAHDIVDGHRHDYTMYVVR